MLPYNQKIAYYQYPELDFDWPVLVQHEDKSTGDILRREFSLFDFQTSLESEILNTLEEQELNEKLSFKIKRKITKIVLTGEYTWTLNNSKDKDDQLLDYRWEYNRFIGWEKRLFDMLHTGTYESETIGNITWGSNSSQSLSELPSDYLSIYIQEEINPIIFAKTSEDNGGGILVIDLGEKTDAINIKNLVDDAKVYWVLAEEEDYEVLNENRLIRKGVHFIQSRYIKLVLPEPEYKEENTNFSINVNSGVDLNSFIQKGNIGKSIKTKGYINIKLLEAKIKSTIDLKTLEVKPVIWEVRSTPPDYNNPLPVTLIDVPISLEVFN